MQNKKYILIPGLIEDERSWTPLINELGSNKCIVINTPGFGMQEALTDGFNFDNYFDYLNAKLEAIDINDSEVIFVGHSLGSVLLLGVLDRIKIENAKFVLLSFPYSSDELHKDSDIILTSLAQMPCQLLSLQQSMLKSDSVIVDMAYNFFRYFFDRDLVAQDDLYGYNLMRDQFSKSDTKTMQNAALMLTTFNHKSILDKTKKKIIIIQGEKDQRVDVDKLKEYKINNKNIIVNFIEDMTHSGFILKAKDLANIISNI